MAAPRDSTDDPEATVSGGFVFRDDGAPERKALSRGDLIARLTALIRMCQGCERVRVVDIAPLDPPDRKGCNWSMSIVLDPAGVAPEVYALGYASVIATARQGWNLE
jgi:hypothetical protein